MQLAAKVHQEAAHAHLGPASAFTMQAIVEASSCVKQTGPQSAVQAASDVTVLAVDVITCDCPAGKFWRCHTTPCEIVDIAEEVDACRSFVDDKPESFDTSAELA